MATTSDKQRWILEVVRGRDVGRAYALQAGETLLGNGLDRGSGLDLSEQETSLARRMAGQHACLIATNDAIWIRDLESPGGTFVSGQRLLSTTPRQLAPGDLIQLGGVQLRVKTASPTGSTGQDGRIERAAAGQITETSSSPTTPGAATSSRPESSLLAAEYTAPGGGICRTRDDFLTLAAQRWTLLRDELTSGRLAAYLGRIQRTDLLPRLDPSQSADEQLDSWLGRLPTSRSSDPELDVHPPSLVIRAADGGGTVRQTLRIANVGYRLLKSQARVEPAANVVFHIAPEFSAHPFLTIDQTDLPVEIEVPERASSASLGAIVIESNGGSRRVEVRLERQAPAGALPVEIIATGGGVGSSLFDPTSSAWPLGAFIAGMPLARRLALAPLALLVLRLLLALPGLLPLGHSPGSRRDEPRLSAIALVFASLGAGTGLVLALRRRENRDLLPTVVAGGFFGLFTAAVGFALQQTVDSLLGGWASVLPVNLLFWTLLGVSLALVSWPILPFSAASSAMSPESTP